MTIFGDYHTHTPYSHGKGTILENALKAKSKGLKELGITDHGFNHVAFSMKRSDLPKIKKEIHEAMQQTGLKIYLGVEANLISLNGKVDIKPEDFEYIELLIVGYHKLVWTGLKNELNFLWKNILTKRPSKKLIQKNTNAYIQALLNYPIDIISHLNHECAVDVVKIAKVASSVGCYIELNGKRLHFDQKQIKSMIEQTDVMFVLNSDAHNVESVGDVSLWEDLIDKYNIPRQRIANLSGGIKLRDKRKFYEK